MLRSDLCNYSDAYIVVKVIATVTRTNNYNKRNKGLVFRNNVLFRSCISKINNSFTDNAKDLDIVMAMYNPLDNYSMTSGGLRNY